MAIIVSELKAFSRDSSTDAFESTTLKQLVDETLDLCHARFAANAVSVFAGDIPERWKVECRSSQIAQVLLNLLNNAYDAVVDQPERWIKVDVLDKNELLEIAVTDSGPGIPAPIAEKIMSPFFTTKPPGKGTGLGLSISSNIMTDHGGRLTVDGSSPHTRFVISLPKKHSEQTLPEIEAQATDTEHHHSFHVSANDHPRSHEDTPARSI
jgi:C4-dicarboxylate-specific signal transduction histidine kinase